MVCGKESGRRIINKTFLLQIKVFLIEIGTVRFSCSDDKWSGEVISHTDPILSGFVPDPLRCIGFR